jgi:hypothetical protein
MSCPTTHGAVARPSPGASTWRSALARELGRSFARYPREGRFHWKSASAAIGSPTNICEFKGRSSNRTQEKFRISSVIGPLPARWSVWTRHDRSDQGASNATDKPLVKVVGLTGDEDDQFHRAGSSLNIGGTS